MLFMFPGFFFISCVSRSVLKPELLKNNQKQWIYTNHKKIEPLGSYYEKNTISYSFLSITGKNKKFQVTESRVCIYSLSDNFLKNISGTFADTPPKYRLSESIKIGRAKPILDPFGFEVEFSVFKRRTVEARTLSELFNRLNTAKSYAIEEKTFYLATDNGNLWKELELLKERGKLFRWKNFRKSLTSPAYRGFVYEKQDPVYSRISRQNSYLYRGLGNSVQNRVIFADENHEVLYYFDPQKHRQDFSGSSNSTEVRKKLFPFLLMEK